MAYWHMVPDTDRAHRRDECSAETMRVPQDRDWHCVGRVGSGEDVRATVASVEAASTISLPSDGDDDGRMLGPPEEHDTSDTVNVPHDRERRVRFGDVFGEEARETVVVEQGDECEFLPPAPRDMREQLPRSSVEAGAGAGAAVARTVTQPRRIASWRAGPSVHYYDSESSRLYESSPLRVCAFDERWHSASKRAHAWRETRIELDGKRGSVIPCMTRVERRVSSDGLDLAVRVRRRVVGISVCVALRDMVCAMDTPASAERVVTEVVHAARRSSYWRDLRLCAVLLPSCTAPVSEQNTTYVFAIYITDRDAALHIAECVKARGGCGSLRGCVRGRCAVL